MAQAQDPAAPDSGAPDSAVQDSGARDAGAEASAADRALGALTRRLAFHPLVQLVVLALITLLRNLLELLGPLTGSRNFCCFYPSLGSFLNTFTYELLLIYGGIFLVHALIGGTREQLQRTISAAILFMLPLFIFVPLCNLALNYHGPEIPIFLFWGLYLPMGSIVGFAAIGVGLPLVLRRVYPERPLWRVLAGLGGGFATMFGWTYVAALYLAYDPGALWLNGPGVQRMDLYSLTFVAPLLLIYPLYLRRAREAGQRRWYWLCYLLAVVGCSAYLTVASNVVTAERRFFTPVICEQVVIPYEQPKPARPRPGAPPQPRWPKKRDAGRLAKAVAETSRRDAKMFQKLRNKYSRAPQLRLQHRLAYLIEPTPPRSTLYRTASGLRPGQVADPIDTGRAFRVLRRVKTPEKMQLAHIFIAVGSKRNGAPGRAPARERAKELWRLLRKAPAGFHALAKVQSDGPFAEHGGFTPPWRPGTFAFLDRIGSLLERGEDRLIESPFGWHIFRRLR
jgi:hypothetical protein